MLLLLVCAVRLFLNPAFIRLVHLSGVTFIAYSTLGVVVLNDLETLLYQRLKYLQYYCCSSYTTVEVEVVPCYDFILSFLVLKYT